MKRVRRSIVAVAVAVLVLLVLPAWAALPTVGTTNKALCDPIMKDAAPNYNWVLWGKVTLYDMNSFTIDDGSGENIRVWAPGYSYLGVTNGSYVVVRGTFDPITKILTSQSISGGVGNDFEIFVTGGKIRPLNNESMMEQRPAPDGYIRCYANLSHDGKYSMLLDIGAKPTRKVASILLQNTTEFATWWVVRKVNVLVSSHEDEPGFDPSNASQYDTTVLSNGGVAPEALYPSSTAGIEAGVWRSATLTAPTAKRFFLIEVTDCANGPISDPATSYFFLGDVSYAHGFAVTGGIISALNTDAMFQTAPAPGGRLDCYADTGATGDAKHSMLLDIGSKPTTAVAAILLQNTPAFTTWRVISKVNIRVSSHEDEAGFDPANTGLYDTTVLSNGVVTPAASTVPLNQAGLQAGIWRTAALTTPAAKRYFLIEVTECPDGPITNQDTSYFFLGDVNYAFGLRAADFGKQWVRNHPFTMDSWSVRWGDYLLDANKRATYMDVLNTALVPLSTMETAGARTTTDDLNLINGAKASGLDWTGQLSCADLGRVSRCVNAITAPLDSNGWQIRDEPPMELLPAVGQVADWLRARRPNSLIYITGMLSFLTDDSIAAVQSAVDTYVKPDILYAGTSYPFVNAQTTRLDQWYYDHLMGIRHYARLYNKPFFAWMQCYWDGYQMYMPSESQMRMNAFGYMTGGCKGLSYFLYDSNDSSLFGGLVTKSGGLTDQYYHVRNMKAEVLNVGKSLRYLENTDLFFLPGPARGGVLSDGETAWASEQGSNVTCTADGTTRKGGSYSAKNVVASDATTGLLATKAFTTTNMSYNTEVYLWIKSSVAVASHQLQLQLDDSANCASPLETFNIPALSANTWTRVVLPFSPTGVDSAMISVGIKQIVDIGACTLWLDEVGTIPVGLSKWSASADPDTHITNITINSPAARYRDGLIGFFTDDSGQNYFMLTNMYQWSNLDKVAARTNFTVTFTPGTVLYRLRRTDGVAEQVPLTNNQYTWDLDGGTGDLFKYDNGTFAGL